MKRTRQRDLAFPNGWGGKRRGAGRKPKGEKAGVSHAKRAVLASRFPVHVTVRLEKGLPSLRRKEAYRVLKRAFAAGSERFGFRLVEYAKEGAQARIAFRPEGEEMRRVMERLDIVIRQEDRVLTRIAYADPGGEKVRIGLSRVRRNVPLARELFARDLPADVSLKITEVE